MGDPPGQKRLVTFSDVGTEEFPIQARPAPIMQVLLVVPQAGNRTDYLFNNSPISQPLSHLTPPFRGFFIKGQSALEAGYFNHTKEQWKDATDSRTGC